MASFFTPLTPDDGDTLEAWRAMERLYDQGVVRQLGVSNFYEPPRLEALCRNARIKPAVIQNRFYEDALRQGYSGLL